MTDDQLADLPHEPDVATVTDDKNVSVSIRCAEDVAQSGQYDDNDDHDTARPDAGKPTIESSAPSVVGDPHILAEKTRLEDDITKLEQKLRGLQDEYQQTKSALRKKKERPSRIDPLMSNMRERHRQSLSDDAADNLVDAHIRRLHEYNEIKDVGQMLLGKVAAMEGTTVKTMYERFGVGLED